MTIEDYLSTVVRPLLKHPDSLLVARSTDDLGVLLSVKTHKEDMGTIVGKEGKTADAIRLLTRIAGYSGNARVSVKFNEPA